MRIVAALALTIIVAGCSSVASGPTPTPVPWKTYHDPRYNFAFQYPSNWSVPARGGHSAVIQGVPSYVVSIHTPQNAAGMQVTVDHDVIPFPSFTEGHVANDPNGGPDTFRYHHLRVDGWPAMQIQRFSGTTVDGIFTIVNTRTLSYTIEVITGTPPFPPSTIQGYNKIVGSMKIPFS